AAHRRRGPVRLAARPAPLPAADERGPDRARGRRARARRRAGRAGRGLRAPRGLDGGQGEWVRMSRRADITRETGETRVELGLDLDGSGAGSRTTGVGFLDHMLDLLARHAWLDLEVAARGDLETGAHHT